MSSFALPPPKQSKRKKVRDISASTSPQKRQQQNQDQSFLDAFVSNEPNQNSDNVNKATPPIVNDNPFRDQKVADIFEMNQKPDQQTQDDLFGIDFLSDSSTIPVAKVEPGGNPEEGDQDDDSASYSSDDTDSQEIKPDKSDHLARKYVTKKFCAVTCDVTSGLSPNNK